MYFDKNLLLSDDQDLTGATDEVSTNTIDLEKTPPDQIGNGERVIVWIQCNEDFAGGTSINFELIESASADLSTPTVLVETGAIALAALLAGARFPLIVPVSRLALRYLGINYDKTGTFTGTDTVTAGILVDGQTAESDWTAETGF